MLILASTFHFTRNEIRARRAAGETRAEIAADLGISYHTVRLIELGRLWSAGGDAAAETRGAA